MMKRYQVVLGHAGGTIAIETVAQTLAQACLQVLSFENAPASAIREIREYGEIGAGRGWILRSHGEGELSGL